MTVLTPIQLPVIRTIKGTKVGPRVAIIGGMHGDELSGAQVVGNFILGDASLQVERGEVVLVLANPSAVKLGRRALTVNMNTLFFHNKRSDAPEASNARIIMDILDQCAASLDLHEHKDVGVGSIAVADSIAYETATALGPEVLVTGLEQIEPGATDSYMAENKKIGICFEAGFIGKDNTAIAHEAILKFLTATGINGKGINQPTTVPKSELNAVGLITKRTPDFRFSGDVVSCCELPPGPFAWDGKRVHTTPGHQAIIFPRPWGPIGSSVGILADLVKVRNFDEG